MAKRKLELVVSNEAPEAEPAELPPQQQEMPFAMVNGEPVTELPKDLYIPPQALEVFLEAFEGPLDLLLYLIRRQNLDVLDIPIAEITRQYMKYIEVMTEMQLELAGEYMVMAATLAEIKSRMLLPRAHVQGDGTEEDPRAELVRRLQEYERFKQAAENIDGLERMDRDTWSASAELKDRKVVRVLPETTLKEMLLAFKDVVVRSEMFAHHHIQRERLSIRQRMSDIVSLLEHSSFVDFSRLFRAEEGRMGVTVTFVAILELVREGLIEIVQTEPFAPLHVRPAGAHRGLRLVANNERGEEEVVADIAPRDEGPTADELLLKSTAPLEDDDDDFDEEDLPLEGVDDVMIEKRHASDDAVPTEASGHASEMGDGDLRAAVSRESDDAFVSEAVSQESDDALVSKAIGHAPGDVFVSEAISHAPGDALVSEATGHESEDALVSKAIGHTPGDVFVSEAVGRQSDDALVNEATGYASGDVFVSEAISYAPGDAVLSEAITHAQGDAVRASEAEVAASEEVAAVEVTAAPVSYEVGAVEAVEEVAAQADNVVAEPNESAIEVSRFDAIADAETDDAAEFVESTIAVAATTEAPIDEEADVVEEADTAHAAIRSDADAIDEAVAAEEAVAPEPVAAPDSVVTFAAVETLDSKSSVADETHEAADELSASDEPDETDESGDADEPNEFSDKPPAGGTTG